MRSVKSIYDAGNRGQLVEVECHLSNNLPVIVIVGSVSKAIDEARERVRAAFMNSSLELPRKKIILNLAPADLPKNDTSFDLAIAVSILDASKQINSERLATSLFIGELGLDGTIRPARGIIGKLLAGRKLGYSTFFIPKVNLQQALLVPGLTLYPLENLREFYLLATTNVGPAPVETKQGTVPAAGPAELPDTLFDEIVGQEHAKRAMVVAAAGGHNLFLSGPPGTGKSMLAQAMPGLLPPLSHDEILEVTQLHSLATSDFDTLHTQRPFRAPHHSASLVALIGGGNHLRPGEISLSHRGVLFLDEMPEFNRVSLEALRQPLEDKTVTIARAKETVTYPASFILVATANPCPCGYYGSAKPCQCTPHMINKYQQRISGPIFDRIDLHSIVHEVDHKNLLTRTGREQTLPGLREQVDRARQLQAKRFASTTVLNADMRNKEIKQYARLEQRAKSLLDEASQRLGVSARAYLKTVKVARTIADLADSIYVELPHITEALQYRRQEQTAL